MIDTDVGRPRHDIQGGQWNLLPIKEIPNNLDFAIVLNRVGCDWTGANEHGKMRGDRDFRDPYEDEATP